MFQSCWPTQNRRGDRGGVWEGSVLGGVQAADSEGAGGGAEDFGGLLICALQKTQWLAKYDMFYQNFFLFSWKLLLVLQYIPDIKLQILYRDRREDVAQEIEGN